MKKYREAGPWLAVALGCVVLPGSANATLRYRTDGNSCRPWIQDTVYEATSSRGFKIMEGPPEAGADAATCAIPTGQSTVDLGGSFGHPLKNLNIRLSQHDSQTRVSTRLIVHDYNSTSYCTCGNTSGDMPPSTYSLRVMGFDCGSCSYAADWLLSVHVNRTGGGTTTIKLISAYDEN